MKKTLLRLTALSCILALFTCLMSGLTLAVGGTCGDGLEWSYDNGNITVSGEGEMDDYADISETPWADLSMHITGVTVSDGVRSIGSCAFSDLYNLTRVSLGSGLRRIGDMAFSDCHILADVKLPDGLTSIGEAAFASDYAIEHITVPASVSYIGAGAFSDMSSLAEIAVESGSEYFTASDGALYDIGVSELYACPGGKTGSFIMPDTVRSIADYALMGCKISSLNMPASLKTIGEAAFSLCSELRHIIIPRGVVSIGESAFTECSALSSISVVNANTHYSAFDGILYSADRSTLVCYPMGKEGKTFTVPDTVKSINGYGFAYSMLENVTVGDSVEEIGSYAFLLCEKLRRVNVGGGIVTVGDYAFSNCIELTELVLPASCETVGTGAFAWCEKLESVTLNSPAYVGSAAFFWCTNLKRVEFLCDAPSDVGDDLFYACEDAMIYYPAGCAGWTTPLWHNYLTTPIGGAPSSGDVNSDGKVNNVDLVSLARFVVGLGEINEAAADMDGSGVVNNTDLVMLARKIVL